MPTAIRCRYTFDTIHTREKWWTITKYGRTRTACHGTTKNTAVPLFLRYCGKGLFFIPAYSTSSPPRVCSPQTMAAGWAPGIRTWCCCWVHRPRRRPPLQPMLPRSPIPTNPLPPTLWLSAAASTHSPPAACKMKRKLKYRLRCLFLPTIRVNINQIGTAILLFVPRSAFRTDELYLFYFRRQNNYTFISFWTLGGRLLAGHFTNFIGHISYA